MRAFLSMRPATGSTAGLGQQQGNGRKSRASVDDEEARAARALGSVRAVAVSDDVALPRGEHVGASVAKLVQELSLDDEEDMPPLAPMIGDIPGRIFDDPRADVSYLHGAPRRNARLAAVLGRRDARPVDRLKR